MCSHTILKGHQTMTERDETRRATNRWLFPPTRRRDAYNLQGLRKIQCGWKIENRRKIGHIPSSPISSGEEGICPFIKTKRRGEMGITKSADWCIHIWIIYLFSAFVETRPKVEFPKITLLLWCII